MGGPRTKLRRSGRTGKVKLKNKAYKKAKPKNQCDMQVRKYWNPRKTKTENMKSLGLHAEPNDLFISKTSNVIKSNNDVTPIITPEELWNIPADGIIPSKPNKIFNNETLSPDNQRYMCRLFVKHGDDYDKMAWDIKLNDMQHNENQLRKMGGKFFRLKEELRVIEVPENVKHLIE